MQVVLGIDAAWTEKNPSGVALVMKAKERWHCKALAPGVDEFIKNPVATSDRWNNPSEVSELDLERLLAVAKTVVLGSPVTLIAVDMPIATTRITGMREADRCISSAFGKYWCGAHAPSAVRPGSVGRSFSDKAIQAGYKLITSKCDDKKSKQLIEVYPHPALLRLLSLKQRYKYKISKSTKLFPQRNVKERIELHLEQFVGILSALRSQIQAIPGFLPESASAVPRLSGLKKYEDVIDALVSAWVGTKFLDGQAEAFGDETAAIWVPHENIA